MCRGSWYRPNENVCRVSSQPWSKWPRSAAFRILIIAASFR